MSQFQLTNNGTTYQLDLEGKVFDDTGNAMGEWSTDQDNQIVINQADGTEERVAVRWQFNENNQLCLLDTLQNEMFNFCTVDGVRPKCALKNAILRVKPSSRNPFQFELRGDWDLNEKHQLEFICNGVKSTLDGILSDKKSRFIYRVRDKQNARINYRLGFAGQWEQNVTDEGVPSLRFLYQKEGDALGVFQMPEDGNLIIENGANQFRYVYDRDNKTFGVTLLGFLKINEKLELTYTIDKQSSKSGDELVAKTTFALQAAFTGNQFDGDLGLVILKDDNTPGNYEMTVTGDYTGVVGATNVMVGFRFSQRRKGKLITRTFGIGGAFGWDNGLVTYTFEVGDRIVELALDVDIKLKNGGDLNSKFSFVGVDGEIRTISFLLGISF
ncbi:MAG: hypothetical protein AAGJ18_11250 [Bacteroidota bacterium]